ncbi:rhamnan synthesis F family protein [Agrobacterium salinitolerans]|uniref:rhamnan synthesis F family protein n=1 Tax=Agrobacterium salinitolerans TaxID=1183413 RepID=UPI00157236B1|nr:rhamnan synthesis F family protein [Agrobacterium salinitolerans]NTA39809.1 hypothetical protein [Agrobacterium salinitolerans]
MGKTTRIRKYLREAVRVVKQVFYFPSEIIKLMVVRRWYDAVTSRSIRYTFGKVAIRDEAAIYLIFPSGGVQGSHREMLNEMIAQKIAPIVVSNIPLGDEDRRVIADLAAIIIERPNVGYDFGGYRDAVLFLRKQILQLRYLWILNDSVWPIKQKDSWFDVARSKNTDFVAATSNYGMPRVDPSRYMEIDWRYSTDHRNFHYASYALGLRSSILQLPAFWSYWEKLNISSDKSKTVRRGEIGFSQFVISKNLSHSETFEVKKLDKDLAACTDEELDKIARELVIPDDEILEALQAQVLKTSIVSEQGRRERIALILTTVARRASIYCLPCFAVPRGFHFLKKSPLALPGQTYVNEVRLIKNVCGSVNYDLELEMEAILDRRL